MPEHLLVSRRCRELSVRKVCVPYPTLGLMRPRAAMPVQAVPGLSAWVGSEL